MITPKPKAVLRLEVGNVWTSMTAGPNLLKLIDEVLTFPVPGSFFSPRFQKRQWDGKKHFVKKTKDPSNVIIQTGILPYLLDKLPIEKIAVRILDIRILPFDKSRLENRMKRPRLTEASWTDDLKYVSFTPDPRKIRYQVDAINTGMFHTFMGHHWPRGVISSATGSGKSAMIAGFIKTCNLPTLFTVHRLDLIKQIRKTFSEVLSPEDIGQIGGGLIQFDRKITISSIQTLDRRRKDPEFKKFLSNVLVWVVDESHLVGSGAYYRVSNAMPRAYYRLGYTGTAFKKSPITDMFARSIFGSEIFSLKSKKLIDDGLSTRPVINLIQGDFSVSPVGDRFLSNDEIYQKHISLNESRNALIAQIAVDDFKKGRRPLIMVSRIAHGKVLRDLISPFHKCVFVSGETLSDDRFEAYGDFQKGEIDVLVVSTIVDTGVDIPCIDSIVLAGAGKDAALMIQRAGRGTRTFKGKTHLMIYDFQDTSRPFSKQVDARMTAFLGEGWEVITREVK